MGRAAELRQLQGWLAKALGGARQAVLMGGEPGIGKTALVEAFVARVGAPGELWIGQGQCIARYGEREAYLPVLEALGRLCREAGGEPLLEVLRRYAPMWVVQML